MRPGLINLCACGMPRWNSDLCIPLEIKPPLLFKGLPQGLPLPASLGSSVTLFFPSKARCLSSLLASSSASFFMPSWTYLYVSTRASPPMRFDPFFSLRTLPLRSLLRVSARGIISRCFASYSPEKSMSSYCVLCIRVRVEL